MSGNIQVIYESNNSNSNNYSTFKTSSSSESFPKMVGNGVFVEYKQTSFASEFKSDSDSTMSDKQKVQEKNSS
jgi:hypothetical protein